MLKNSGKAFPERIRERMNRQEIIDTIRKKRSFLCVGLDPDMDLMPPVVRNSSDNPLFEFNRIIIDATIDLAVAYKPNIAFYESHGSLGWKSLEKTAEYLASHPRGPVFTIADAKRADIGNSSCQYAKTFLENLPFDAVTVNPYMGYDSVKPFLDMPAKWTVILALTSNPGAGDFQTREFVTVVREEKPGIGTPLQLHQAVLETCLTWGSPENMMFVVGATRPSYLADMRKRAPDHFFLVPGVGAQGGKLAEVAAHGMNQDTGILVNSSRGIIHASRDEDFDVKAREAALALQKQMEIILGASPHKHSQDGV